MQSIYVRSDGDSYCATRGDFFNSQESIVGWGTTREEAIANLKKNEEDKVEGVEDTLNTPMDDRVDVLRVIHDEAQDLFKNVKKLGITDNTEKDIVSFTSVANKKIKEFDGYRKEYVQPLKQEAKEIDNKFNAYIKPLKEMVKELKGMLEGYYQKIEEAKLEEQKEKTLEVLVNKEKAVDSFQQKIIDEQVQQQEEISATHKIRVNTDEGSITVNKKWDFEVLNINDVPREYLKIDEEKVMEVINQDKRDIPGLKIFLNSKITLR